MKSYFRLVVFCCFVLWTPVLTFSQTPCLPPSAFANPTPSPTPNKIVQKITPPVNANSEVVSAQDLIHPGDLIDVDFVGTTEYDWRGNLDQDGNLKGLDYAQDPIFGLCQTVGEISSRIEKSYSKFLREPKVIVRILDRSARPLSLIYGAVKTPRRLNIQRPISLNELLILSGGVTEQASGIVKIFRPVGLSCPPRIPETSEEVGKSKALGKEQFLKVKASDQTSETFSVKLSDIAAGKTDANLAIRNGDIVTVESAKPIYIIGGVANPQQIFARQEITLSRAIASSGGLSTDADPTKVVIYRRASGLNQTQIFEIDFSKIMDKSLEDFILQAYDVIEIEQTGKTKRRFPPILRVAEDSSENNDKLPLLVID